MTLPETLHLNVTFVGLGGKSVRTTPARRVNPDLVAFCQSEAPGLHLLPDLAVLQSNQETVAIELLALGHPGDQLI